MKVSVLTPVYGVEKYIKECAESLFNQTYQDIEYIFCNDATPDKSIDILREVMERYPHRKNHVRIIENEKNRGLGGTRAHLVSEINSDYFCIVDSDDVLPPDAVEKLVRRAEETDADIVEGAYATYDNGKLGEAILPSHKTGSTYMNQVLCRYKTSIQVWAKIYKTSLIKRLPPLFYDGIDVAEDILATSCMVSVATRAWTDDVVYWYRTDNATSYTKNLGRKAHMSYYKALSHIREYYSQRGTLPLSVEIGLLNAYRDCAPDNYSVEDVDKVIQYVPEHAISRMQYMLFHSRYVPQKVSDTIYRIIRILVYYSY